MMPGWLDWGFSALPKRGETVSGDSHLVLVSGSAALVAVVDGLGHGREAALAARNVIATLELHADESLATLFRRCDWRLRQSRGVVMGLALLDHAAGSLTWLGVGNVKGVLVRDRMDRGLQRKRLLVRGGIVGGRLPVLTTETFSLSPGDMLILATDGVDVGFADHPLPGPSTPKEQAAHLLRTFSTDSDDALVVVARYLGDASWPH